MNQAWTKRKSVHEKVHKYAGSPDLLLDKGNIGLSKENSAEAKRTRNKAIHDNNAKR